jgi:tRNA1(Val) A37 N6-methylase TrmN6
MMMGCSGCDFEHASDRQFTGAKAAEELQAYRKGRLGPTTRLLCDGIVEAGLNQGALLDVGGGVGPLTFELLTRGITRAIIAEASSAYVASAIDEAMRRRLADRAEVVHGDFLRVASRLPSVDLVTLDRVVCCYPAYEPLLEQALRHAERAIALSYPRDRWYVRLGMWLENAKRARGSGFRTFVHPPPRIQEIIQRSGFALVRRRFTIMWTIDVFARRSGATSGSNTGTC